MALFISENRITSQRLNKHLRLIITSEIPLKWRLSLVIHNGTNITYCFFWINIFFLHSIQCIETSKVDTEQLWLSPSKVDVTLHLTALDISIQKEIKSFRKKKENTKMLWVNKMGLNPGHFTFYVNSFCSWLETFP